AGLDHRGAEPVVAGGEELGLLLIGRPPAREGDALRSHDLAVYQVVDWFADKRVVRKGRAEQVIAVDNGTARRREMVGPLRVIEAGQCAADGEHLGSARRYRNRHFWVGAGDVRIAAEVMVG